MSDQGQPETKHASLGYDCLPLSCGRIVAAPRNVGLCRFCCRSPLLRTAKRDSPVLSGRREERCGEQGSAKQRESLHRFLRFCGCLAVGPRPDLSVGATVTAMGASVNEWAVMRSDLFQTGKMLPFVGPTKRDDVLPGLAQCRTSRERPSTSCGEGDRRARAGGVPASEET